MKGEVAFLCVPIVRPTPLAGNFVSDLGQAGLHRTGYRPQHFFAFEFVSCLYLFLSSPLLCSSAVYLAFCLFRVFFRVLLWLCFCLLSFPNLDARIPTPRLRQHFSAVVVILSRLVIPFTGGVMRYLILAGVVLAFSGLSATAQTPEMIEKVEKGLELKRLEGAWIPKYLVTSDGLEYYPVQGRALVFTDKTFARIEGQKLVHSGSFKISLKERHLDFTVEETKSWDVEKFTEEPKVPFTLNCTYRVTGDLLTICQTGVGKKHPDDLKPGEGRTVVVYERQKEGTKLAGKPEKPESKPGEKPPVKPEKPDTKPEKPPVKPEKPVSTEFTGFGDATTKAHGKQHLIASKELLVAPIGAKAGWMPNQKIKMNESIAVNYPIEMKDVEIFECSSESKDIRVGLVWAEKGVTVTIRSGIRDRDFKKANGIVRWKLIDFTGREYTGIFDVMFE